MTVVTMSVVTFLRFQSTQSSQTVTGTSQYGIIIVWISIHTVLADCDVVRRMMQRQSTISIHTVLADCDFPRHLSRSIPKDFNPHSPRRLWLQLCMIFTIKYNLPSYTMHKSLFILYYIFSRNQILCALFWCESPRHFMFAWDSHHNTCIPFFW